MSHPDASPVLPLTVAATDIAALELADALTFLIQSPGGTEAAVRPNEEYDAVTHRLRQSVAEELASAAGSARL